MHLLSYPFIFTRLITRLCIKWKLSLIVPTLICFVNVLNAQQIRSNQANGEIQRLEISEGAHLPEPIWNISVDLVNHPSGNSRMSLGEIANTELVVLDFWATWCAPCVTAIPKNMEIQQEYKDRLMFVLVSREDRETLKGFLDRQSSDQGLCPSWTVWGDSTLHRTFPTRLIPHYVIIHKGIYKGALEADQLTRENIQRMLENDWEGIKFKKKEKAITHRYDENGLLYVDGNGGGKEFIAYHSVFGPYNPSLGYGSTKGIIPSENGGRLSFLNIYIPWFYQVAFGAGRNTYYQLNRVVLDVADRSKLIHTDSGLDAKEWIEAGNVYNYELSVGPALGGRFYEIMKQDLARIFPQYTAHEEIRDMDCWVLKIMDRNRLDGHRTRSRKTRTKFDMFGISLERISLNGFFSMMKDYFMQSSTEPLIADYQYPDLIDIELSTQMSDINKVNDSLREYGIRFIKEKRPLQVLVISDNPKKDQDEN